MPALAERILVLDSLSLDKGEHSDFESGHCALEVVAWIAGEDHSDHPKCVCPVVANFVRRWNDDLNDEDRQILKPYLPKLIDTKRDRATEQRRGWILTDWLIRTHTPAWLELVPSLKTHAESLRALPEITNAKALHNVAAGALSSARKDAAAARGAARSAARAAARSAAWAAARSAAWAAAWDASAAGTVSWVAVGTAAWAAAWAAARDAAKKKPRADNEIASAECIGVARSNDRCLARCMMPGLRSTPVTDHRRTVRERRVADAMIAERSHKP